MLRSGLAIISLEMSIFDIAAVTNKQRANPLIQYLQREIDKDAIVNTVKTEQIVFQR